MGIIRRLVTTGENIGHASEDEARAFFDARNRNGSLGTVVTPEGHEVTLHEEGPSVEESVQAHTQNAGQSYQGIPEEGEDSARANPQKYAQ